MDSDVLRLMFGLRDCEILKNLEL